MDKEMSDVDEEQTHTVSEHETTTNTNKEDIPGEAENPMEDFNETVKEPEQSIPLTNSLDKTKKGETLRNLTINKATCSIRTTSDNTLNTKSIDIPINSSKSEYTLNAHSIEAQDIKELANISLPRDQDTVDVACHPNMSNEPGISDTLLNKPAKTASTYNFTDRPVNTLAITSVNLLLVTPVHTPADGWSNSDYEPSETDWENLAKALEEISDGSVVQVERGSKRRCSGLVPLLLLLSVFCFICMKLLGIALD